MTQKTLLSRLKLWPHQTAAHKMAQYYLKRWTATSSTGAALVNIPTGGGKTAVIALLAHEGHGVQRVLVLAPRLAIRKQLHAELSATRVNGFFAKQGIRAADLHRTVSQLEEGDDINVAPNDARILVSTIQLIDRFRQQSLKAFAKFAASIDLVLVDEGHYEPAPSWSTTVRGFQKPVVLLTATPYRNDLRSFDIDPTAIHVTRLADLVSNNFVRTVKIVPCDRPQSATAFADEVLKTFASEFGGQPDAAHKLIIRCQRKEDIEKVGAAFVQKRLTVVGLHERFTNADAAAYPWRRRFADDPEKAGAPVIWVHQHKLLEGVDGPSFRAVAMYKSFGSARALVQQVGRIIRNRDRRPSEVALVMDHLEGQVGKHWSRFKKYDETLTARDLRRGAPEIAREALENLPSLDYIAETFRVRFDIGMNFDPGADISLPTSVYFLRKDSQFDIANLIAGIREELRERTLIHRYFQLKNDQHLLIYIAWRNSPLLPEHYFVEFTLGAIAIRNFSDHISFLDTAGSVPLRAEDLAIGGPAELMHLARLMPRRPGTRIASVTTRNGALGPRAARTRRTSAASIADMVPYLDDFQHIPTALVGTSTDKWRPTSPGNAQSLNPKPRHSARRYLGLVRGHITEAGRRLAVSDYFKWVETAAARLNGTGRPIPLFSRYARVLNTVPRAPDPRNILLDHDEAHKLFVTDDDVEGLEPGEPLELTDACADCAAGKTGAERAFKVHGHGKKFDATVHFDARARRYIIRSADLDSAFRSIDEATPDSLVSFLNRSQSFIIVPETAGALFAYGEFFSPGIGVGAQFDKDRFPIGKAFQCHAALETILSEKGDDDQLPATAIGWNANSVFGWFDAHLDDLFDDPSLVICDDMGTESADFIALDRDGERVVMVHCKGTNRPHSYGASPLHVVCSQAVKNCGTLNPFNPAKPVNVKRWHEPWKSPAVTGSVTSKIRRGGRGRKDAGFGDRLWRRFDVCLRNPNIEREVWLILGATLSRKDLIAELRKDTSAPEALQATHLLNSTMASVAASNARLKILCSP
jgi:superfamily II DNA or RNA helicase